MGLQLTNTLTRKKEAFVPLKAGEVRMYVCGPTVYGLTHVGNARPVVFFDVVRRFLEHRGFKVTFVSNYTDVDDKIINRAREEKTTSLSISEKYIVEFRRDMDALGVQKPQKTPKVTEHIPQIIKFIEGLVKADAAYVAADGEVLFSVRGFKEYGKLSGKQVDELLVGVRIDANEKKRDPLDFSLWKPQKADDEPAWDSPWGKGRPGWHIECSVMATEYLGETFDIHGGGIDLVHPHHENEIAQAEALTKKPFAKYWMHNNLVTITGEKMAKSVGNIFLNRDFIAKFGAETLRYLLLSGHYRSPIDFSEKHIRECQAALHRVYSSLRKCELLMATPPAGTAQATPEEKKIQELGESFAARWEEAMDDDFNTAKLLGIAFEYVRAMNGYIDKKGFKWGSVGAQIVRQYQGAFTALSKITNLFGDPPAEFLKRLKALVLVERGLSSESIEQKIVERQQARERKDFAAADLIRNDLMKQGIELRDSPLGTDWDIIFT